MPSDPRISWVVEFQPIWKICGAVKLDDFPGVKIKNNYCIWNRHHHLDLDHDIFNFQSGMPSSNGTEKGPDLEARNPETIRFPRIYWKLLLMGSEIRPKTTTVGMYKNLVNNRISTTNLIWSARFLETSTVYDVSFVPCLLKHLVP